MSTAAAKFAGLVTCTGVAATGNVTTTALATGLLPYSTTTAKSRFFTAAGIACLSYNGVWNSGWSKDDATGKRLMSVQLDDSGVQVWCQINATDVSALYKMAYFTTAGLTLMNTNTNTTLFAVDTSGFLNITPQNRRLNAHGSVYSYSPDDLKTVSLAVDNTGIASITSSGAEFDFPSGNVVKVLNTTNATDPFTGALNVAGGLGVQRESHLGDIVTIHNASDIGKSAALSADATGNLMIQPSGTTGHGIVLKNATDPSKQVTIAADAAGNFVFTPPFSSSIGSSITLTNGTETAILAVDASGDFSITPSALNTTISGDVVNSGKIGPAAAVRVVDKAPSALFRAEGYRSINADYTAGSGSLTGVTGLLPALAVIDSGKIRCNNASVQWALGTGAIQPTVGTFRFKYTPNYSGYPVGNIVLFDSYTSPTYNEVILQHWNATGALQFTTTDSTGANGSSSKVIVATWSAVAGKEYEFEFNWTTAGGGSYRLYIDGQSVGTATDTSSISTRNAAQYFAIGTSNDASWRDIVVFGTALHSSASYATGYSALPMVEAPTIKALEKVQVLCPTDMTKSVLLAVDSSGKGSITSSGAEFDFPATDIVKVLNPTDATALGSAAVVISGGLSLAKKAHMGDTVTLHNISDATKQTTLAVDTTGVLIVTPSAALSTNVGSS
ncbi:MAG: hypothetical protein P4L69_05810, partial [Desulfosporosinus sp.]|nr:hypothetical protein [Desulfosporosinus sp.]